MNNDWIPKNKGQYVRTKELALNFREALLEPEKRLQENIDMGVSPKIAQACVNAMASMAETLERQAKRYENIKDAGLKVTLGVWNSTEGLFKRATLSKKGKPIITSSWMPNEDEAIQEVYEWYLRNATTKEGT